MITDKKANKQYRPLSKKAIRQILDLDKRHGFGIGGYQANRTRFYAYLVQNGKDIQVRTVAVKAPKRHLQPVVKEVTRCSVDSPTILVKDLVFMGMAGYVVNWNRNGFGTPYSWSYENEWGDEPYSLRCAWKLYAPIVNLDLLKQTDRFKYSDYESCSGHLLDYLKVYAENPGIEFFAKCGLGWLSTKVSIVRKLEKDQNFKTWFGRNIKDIKSLYGVTVPVIMRSYKHNISIAEACSQVAIINKWRETKLPSALDKLKAGKYVEASGTFSRYAYKSYIENCQFLGLNLSDTKVAFPHNFKERQRTVQDKVDAIHRQQRQAEVKRINCKMKQVAQKWEWLTGVSGDFVVIIPTTEQELEAEEKAMKNCIGSYANRIVRGDSIVAFVRKASAPEQAFVDVEYSLKSNKVTQVYASQNSKPPAEVQTFVESIFQTNDHANAA
jgi:hypothetical protein